MLGAVFLVTQYRCPLPRDIPCDVLDSFVWFAGYCIDCHVITLSCLFSFRGAPCPLYMSYRLIPRYITTFGIRPFTDRFILTPYLTPRGILLPTVTDSLFQTHTLFQTLSRPRRSVTRLSRRPYVLVHPRPSMSLSVHPRSSRIAPTTTSFLIGPSSNTGASTCT